MSRKLKPDGWDTWSKERQENYKARIKSPEKLPDGHVCKPAGVKTINSPVKLVFISHPQIEAEETKRIKKGTDERNLDIEAILDLQKPITIKVSGSKEWGRLGEDVTLHKGKIYPRYKRSENQIKELAIIEKELTKSKDNLKQLLELDGYKDIGNGILKKDGNSVDINEVVFKQGDHELIGRACIGQIAFSLLHKRKSFEKTIENLNLGTSEVKVVEGVSVCKLENGDVVIPADGAEVYAKGKWENLLKTNVDFKNETQKEYGTENIKELSQKLYDDRDNGYVFGFECETLQDSNGKDTDFYIVRSEGGRSVE